ncbi:Peroxisomal acyl-coenzyme a oxidase, partial [Globisporangium splendens]
MSATELKDLAPLLLKKERAGGDVNPVVLTNILRESAEKNARRKEMTQVIADHPVLSDRDMLYRNHTQRYNYGIKKAYHYVRLLKEKNITDPVDQQYLYRALGEPLGMDVHRSMFIPTLENQADEEQQKKWLPLAKNYKIFGAYAQTELGHGSNVQGIETTAHYDKAAQQFIINSPTLTSRKWWPGGLGKTANHAIVHARLFLDGADVGVQAFLVQLRSLENHEPLPGIECGDIGPKVGFQSVDNGYCAFHNVRIPRENMMMRYAKVLPDGTFVKPKSDKLVYLTMVEVRANLIHSFGLMMASAATITTRFSAARVQGRTPTGKGEFQVLDYQNQQNALFPFIAISYAANFAGRWIMQLHNEAVDIIKFGKGSFGQKLAELHATTSGLKAWLAVNVSDGIETCRRMCGGHGFTNSSNLGHIFAEIVGANTFEGTFDVLVQQHARYLLKVLVTMPFKSDATGEVPPPESNSTSFLAKTKQYANPSVRCSAQKPEDFANFKLLLEAFETRAARIVVRLAKQMQATNNDSNACMVLMTRASTAHAELLLLDAFVKGVASVPAGPTQVAVAKLCALFGSSLIVKSLGDFREDNYLSSAQGELVRQYIVSLLPVVRKNAVLLTDAWDFSDFELNSTIGRYDGDIYRALVKRAADEPLNKTQVAESYEKYLKPLIQSDL